MNVRMKEQEQQEIFEDWLNRHSALLFKVIRAYAFHREDREDLFQEITLQVWRSVPNFKGGSAVTTWLYRIALNTAIRWSSRQRKHRDGHQDLDQAAGLLREQDHPPDDRLTWLYEQIALLNPIERSLTLLLLDGFSYKDMSSLLGISESNVAVKVHRIKKHLVKQSKIHS